MSIRRLGVLAAGIATVALIGCTPPTQNWSAAQSQKRNVVSWAEYHHDVAFAARSAEMSADESAALAVKLGEIVQQRRIEIACAEPFAYGIKIISYVMQIKHGEILWYGTGSVSDLSIQVLTRSGGATDSRFGQCIAFECSGRSRSPFSYRSERNGKLSIWLAECQYG